MVAQEEKPAKQARGSFQRTVHELEALKRTGEDRSRSLRCSIRRPASQYAYCVSSGVHMCAMCCKVLVMSAVHNMCMRMAGCEVEHTATHNMKCSCRSRQQVHIVLIVWSCMRCSTVSEFLLVQKHKQGLTKDTKEQIETCLPELAQAAFDLCGLSVEAGSKDGQQTGLDMSCIDIQMNFGDFVHSRHLHLKAMIPPQAYLDALHRLGKVDAVPDALGGDPLFVYKLRWWISMLPAHAHATTATCALAP
jgi:hypothetical protein